MGGFFKDLGKSIWSSIKENTAKGIMHASGYDASTGEVRDAAYEYDAYGNITGVSRAYVNRIAELYNNENYNSSDPRVVMGLNSSRGSISYDNGFSVSKWGGVADKNSGPVASQVSSSAGHHLNNMSDRFYLKLPDWNYADFINERAIWQKGLSSAFDEPAWFYFKIIFDFDTANGLFGGILNYDPSRLRYTNNSAGKYLESCRSMYRQEKIYDRIEALYKFTSILSYITTNAPWYFKAVKGLDKVSAPVINDFSAEKSIELDLNIDAIDMRLSTLMSLYQYACFDKFNGKEIIPQNLRLFNMTIILFQTPLRYLHTSYISNKKNVVSGIKSSKINKLAEKLNASGLKVLNNDSIITNIQGSIKRKYKSMTYENSGTTNYSDMMSMKIFTFEGCEFDPTSFAAIIPGSVSNEMPFKMGDTSIKITYTRSIEHTMNEFYAMMFGGDGFYFNNYAIYQQAPYGYSNDAYWGKINGYWSKQIERYNSLSETLEDVARGGRFLGVESSKTFKKAIDASEAIMNGVLSDSDLLSKIGTNFLLKQLGTSYSLDSSQGNLYGNVGIGSDYFKEQLNKLKNSDHDNTTAPYAYDPSKTVSHERSKAKNVQYNTSVKVTNYDEHLNTETPYAYDPKTAVTYEKTKTVDIANNTSVKIARNQELIDNYKENKAHSYTEAPYVYDPKIDFNLNKWLRKST